MIPGRRLREHALLSLVVALTRAALYGAGLRFNFALDWMWLADPQDLRDRLAETAYYFHAFPPGMNLLTSAILELGGSEAPAVASIAWWLLGVVLANALLHLFRVAGLSGPAAFALALGFSLLPQAIYFEHLYHYELPVTVLLVLSAVLLHAAVARQTTWAWLGFFLAASAIALTRSVFHLAWFAALLGLALWFTGREGHRRVLQAAAVPAILVLALYVKNFVVFGTFAALTFGSASHTLVTVSRLPPEVRDAWIEQGTLSRFAAVSVFAGPRDYLPLLRAEGRDRAPHEWPPQVTRLDRPSVGAPNFNHWVFLEVNRARRADALQYLSVRPVEYAGTVVQGVASFFAPTTTWHPRDRDASPHAQHRRVLGRYEVLFNRIVHQFPVAPAGLYVLLPFVAVWAALRARRFLAAADPAARALGALVAFCLFQIVYVAAVSTLLTYTETARYRFQVEAMIWVLAAACVGSRHLAKPKAQLPTADSQSAKAQIPRHSPR